MKARNTKPAGDGTEKQRWKGQSSVELILIITLALILGMMFLSRFMNVQESVFPAASARQQLISEVDKLTTPYETRGITTAECGNSVRINITISPNPELNDDNAIISPKIKEAVASTRNLGQKTVCVAYNSPQKLDCGQTCI